LVTTLGFGAGTILINVIYFFPATNFQHLFSMSRPKV